MPSQPVVNHLRRFLTRSPVWFVSLFYIGAGLGLLVQELMLRKLLTGDVASNVAFGVFIFLVFFAPAWGVLRSVWLLAHNQQKADSLVALLLSLPLFFVVIGTLQRS